MRLGYVNTDNGNAVDRKTHLLLGGASALALVLGQYPYLYLTVAFIQMLKAFSPAYMVVFLYVLGVEYPSRKVIACVAGLSIFTAVASAGEVRLSLSPRWEDTLGGVHRDRQVVGGAEGAAHRWAARRKRGGGCESCVNKVSLIVQGGWRRSTIRDCT